MSKKEEDMKKLIEGDWLVDAKDKNYDTDGMRIEYDIEDAEPESKYSDNESF